MKPVKSPAYVAAALAAISGLISLYWALGGTMGIRTVGGPVAEFAQKGGALPMVLAICTALVKFAGALFALAFVRVWGRRISDRLLRFLGWLAGACLAGYGLLNVAVGALVLCGVLHSPHADRYALKWHVFGWDAYFVVWGVALLITVYRFETATKLRRRGSV